jgi:hypothetical protein
MLTGVKVLSGLCIVAGIFMFVNAATATWPLDESAHREVYRLADVVLGLAFWGLSWVLFSVYRTRQLHRLEAGVSRSDVDLEVI